MNRPQCPDRERSGSRPPFGNGDTTCHLRATARRTQSAACADPRPASSELDSGAIGTVDNSAASAQAGPLRLGRPGGRAQRSGLECLQGGGRGFRPSAPTDPGCARRGDICRVERLSRARGRRDRTLVVCEAPPRAVHLSGRNLRCGILTDSSSTRAQSTENPSGTIATGTTLRCRTWSATLPRRRSWKPPARTRTEHDQAGCFDRLEINDRRRRPALGDDDASGDPGGPQRRRPLVASAFEFLVLLAARLAPLAHVGVHGNDVAVQRPGAAPVHSIAALLPAEPSIPTMMHPMLSGAEPRGTMTTGTVL